MLVYTAKNICNKIDKVMIPDVVEQIINHFYTEGSPKYNDGSLIFECHSPSTPYDHFVTSRTIESTRQISKRSLRGIKYFWHFKTKEQPLIIGLWFYDKPNEMIYLPYIDTMDLFGLDLYNKVRASTQESLVKYSLGMLGNTNDD